jgi:hypothetical protein
MQTQDLVTRLEILHQGAKRYAGPEFAEDVAKLISDIKSTGLEDGSVPARYGPLDFQQKRAVDRVLLALYDSGITVRARVMRRFVDDGKYVEHDASASVIALSKSAFSLDPRGIAKLIVTEDAKLRSGDPSDILAEAIISNISL